MIQNDPKCSRSWQQISQPERLSGHQHVAFPSLQPAANPQKQQCVRCAIFCTIWDCPNMRNAPKLLFSNVRLILFEWENDDLQVPNFGTRPSGAGLFLGFRSQMKATGAPAPLLLLPQASSNVLFLPRLLGLGENEATTTSNESNLLSENAIASRWRMVTADGSISKHLPDSVTCNYISLKTVEEKLTGSVTSYWHNWWNFLLLLLYLAVCSLKLDQICSLHRISQPVVLRQSVDNWPLFVVQLL